MQRRMSREELQRLHQMEQQKEAIDRGDKGKFTTFDDQCVDYMKKLLEKETWVCSSSVAL